MRLLNKNRHVILSISLIVITVGFIWINSAMPGSQSGQFSGFVRDLMQKFFEITHFPAAAADFLLEHVRKVAHVTEYAVIGFELGFLWVGLGRGFQGFWNAFSSVLTIAVLDETIQLLALARGPQITDVLLDTASAFSAILIVYFVWIIAKCIKYGGE